jgi:hypothetical protein
VLLACSTRRLQRYLGSVLAAGVAPLWSIFLVQFEEQQKALRLCFRFFRMPVPLLEAGSHDRN